MNIFLTKSKQFLSHIKLLFRKKQPLLKISQFATSPELKLHTLYFGSENNKDGKKHDTEEKNNDQTKDKVDKPPKGGDNEPNNNDNDPKNKFKQLFEKYGNYFLIGSGIFLFYLYQDYFDRKIIEISINVL